jgi:hypothetical protein
MNKATFEEWMAAVDLAVERLIGCSVYDLSDYCFRDAYDDGRSPVSVARAAIRNGGFE